MEAELKHAKHIYTLLLQNKGHMMGNDMRNLSHISVSLSCSNDHVANEIPRIYHTARKLAEK